MHRCTPSSHRLLISVLSALIFVAPALLAGQMASGPKSKVPLAMVLGQSRSIQVAKPFGMLTDSIPIIVPPGRRDVEPHMQLTYSSGGENGILGLGWDLNLGYVELNRRNGLPASGEVDTYNFSIAGLAGELHNNGAGVYHSRTELVYREFRKTTAGGWEMRDGQGNRYLFGSSSQSQISMYRKYKNRFCLVRTICYRMKLGNEPANAQSQQRESSRMQAIATEATEPSSC